MVSFCAEHFRLTDSYDMTGSHSSRSFWSSLSCDILISGPFADNTCWPLTPPQGPLSPSNWVPFPNYTFLSSSPIANNLHNYSFAFLTHYTLQAPIRGLLKFKFKVCTQISDKWISKHAYTPMVDMKNWALSSIPIVPFLLSWNRNNK